MRNERDRLVQAVLREGMPDMAPVARKNIAGERLLRRDPSLLGNELQEFKNSVRNAVADMRRFMFELRPVSLDDLGLMGLRNLVLYSGFDGRAERGLIEWDMPGPRKGLLTLLSGKPFKLGDVPPLPSDVVSWTMTNFDVAAFYDTAYQAAEQIVGLVSPDDVPKVKEIAKQANDLLGVDLRKDLLGSLGDQLAYYTSPADGPFTLGQTVLFNKALARKAGEHGVELVDLYLPSREEVPRQSALLWKDGYHPSDAGYARWAELMWEGIEPHLAGC